MFEQAVQMSEAMRESATGPSGTLMPALCGCEDCRRLELVAAPTLGKCGDCGAELKAVAADQLSTGPAAAWK